jgi:spore photoproduct lyase
MSVNPQEIITKAEFRTSPLETRIEALNRMCRAGYPVGLLIAPVILTEGWKEDYRNLLDVLHERLTEKVKREMKIEVIFMTYSYVHRAINAEAFPNAADLYDAKLMTGRGMGRYRYGAPARAEAEPFLRREIEGRFGASSILYIV